MVFRYQDNDHFYRFLVSGDGYYLVGGQLEDKWTVLQDWTESAFIKQGNNTNRLQVVGKGSQIDVYVNGHHLTTVTDDSFAEGYVGPLVNAPEPNCRVAFDNIKVYRLD